MPDSNFFDGPEGLDWRLVVRYLADECAPDERARVDAWAAGSDAARAYLDSLRVLGEEAGERSDVQTDPDRMWAQARSRLGLDLARRRLSGGTATVRPMPRHDWAAGMPRAQGVAWVLFACAVAALVAVGRSSHRGAREWRLYATAAGQQKKVTLPDGSDFTLGPATTLRIPVDYASGNRTVSLAGEALFSVAHDARHPFAVRVDNTLVTDVGTVFDVRGYADDRAVRVAVAEGRVDVAAGRVPGMPVVSAHMGAGDVAIVRDTAVAVAHGTDVAMLTAWTRGTLVFRETPLRVALQDLARAYGAKVTVADSALAGVPFTANLPTEPLSQALEIVASAVGAGIERTGQGYRLVAHRSPSTAHR